MQWVKLKETVVAQCKGRVEYPSFAVGIKNIINGVKKKTINQVAQTCLA